jgi:hypothetical protein
MGMIKKETSTTPPVPELPKTSVNPQPRNEESPVKAAVKRPTENGKSNDITMSKGDWANKDRGILVSAIIKSTLESPVVAQMTHGKSDEQVLQTLTKVIKHSLAVYEEVK